MKIILDLSNYNSIPKIIHLSWKNKDVFNEKSPMILNGLLNIKKLNPTYKLELSDDNDVENYLKDKLNYNDYKDIMNKHIVQKVDLWRLLKLYYEGGIYLDFDRYSNKSFDEIINKETKCILPTYFDSNFSQDIMISCKNNPIYMKAIEYNIEARKRGKRLYDISVPTYMNSITEIVFGKKYGEDPGVELMQQFRKLLNESKQYQTYREEPHDKLFNYTYSKYSFLNGNNESKIEFYARQNVVHWLE